MAAALDRARGARREQAWRDAYALFAAAESEEILEPEDLEDFALAAYLTGRDAECESLWVRAHRARLDRGEPRAAARCAFWLALPLLLRGETARGGGWLARAARLLPDAQGDCPERGLLLVPVALRALYGGEPADAAETCARIEEIGERFADPDVLAYGRLGRGQALIALGQVQQGVSLLDEAMVAVTADAVSPITTGVVYCAVLLACRETFDLARAEEWTAELTRWCDAQQDLVPFRGECLVHRAEVLQLRGEWAEAITEARRACEWLAGRPAAGRAHYQLGELQRVRGAFAEAEREYRAASDAGREPQPGCALLRVAQGEVDAAAAMVERALGNARGRLGRATVLPASVEVALAGGTVPAARQAAEELSALAGERDAALLHALAAYARGTVLAAEGDPGAALEPLQASRARWEELAAPYELARTRAAVALALRGLGDDAGAELELEAARGAFARLGAAPELARIDGVAGGPDGAAAAGLTGRELEVLAHVARGRTNAEIAAALVISPHTVRRHLQNVFRKLGVSSRAAAAAFAVRHDLVEAGGMARTDQ